MNQHFEYTLHYFLDNHEESLTENFASSRNITEITDQKILIDNAEKFLIARNQGHHIRLANIEMKGTKSGRYKIISVQNLEM